MTELLEAAVLFVAGLGLFFTGVSGIRTKLQQLSGRRFRRFLIHLTDRPMRAGMVGVSFGAVTQSASAVAFILSGMVATGLMPLRRALPVVAAANIGTAALVFLAALDLQLAILALLGITGLMINFHIAARIEPLLGALFATGLLFLGLGMMKQAFAPLPGYSWFLDLAGLLADVSVATFVLGAALRLVVQSSSAIGVIAIALQHAGLFTEFQSIMLICGTGPGVAAAGLLLSGNLSGVPRQIVFYQGLISLLAGCVAGFLFLLSEVFGHRGLFLLMDLVGAESDHRLAWVFFLNMVGCFAAGLALLPWAERLLTKLAPPTPEENLARPAYLHEQALEVPETAIDLVDKDQQRLFSLAILSLDAVREESEIEPKARQGFHDSALSLRREIGEFIGELIHHDVSNEATDRVLLLQRRQENLAAVHDSIQEFAETRAAADGTSAMVALFDQLTESLHLVLLTAQDAWISGDEADLDHLLSLTKDRGHLMERIRSSFQNPEYGSIEARSALFQATTVFERIVWLLRQFALTLGKPQSSH